MNILTIKNEVADKIFSMTIIFNYEKVLPAFGLEATSNLVDAFNTELVQSLEKNLNYKHQEGTSSSVINGKVKFVSDNREFLKIITDLVNAINTNSKNIIAQISQEDLLLEDEQKEFFNKIISYELLHILLKMETDRVRGGDNSDKKSSKI